MYFQITEFSTSDRCHLKSCLCHRRAMCQWVRYKLSESESVSSPASKMLIHAVQKCSVLWVLHWHRAWQVADVQINGSGCYYCYCLDPSLIIMSRVEGCCEHKRGGLLWVISQNLREFGEHWTCAPQIPLLWTDFQGTGLKEQAPVIDCSIPGGGGTWKLNSGAGWGHCCLHLKEDGEADRLEVPLETSTGLQNIVCHFLKLRNRMRSTARLL